MRDADIIIANLKSEIIRLETRNKVLAGYPLNQDFKLEMAVAKEQVRLLKLQISELVNELSGPG